MQIHIMTTNESYRNLLKHLGENPENHLNTMDWHEMDDSNNITIAGKNFKVKGEVNGESIFMIHQFQIDEEPTIWLKPYTFPSSFWATQNG